VPFSLLVDAVPETLPRDYSMRACEITVCRGWQRSSMLILSKVAIFKVKMARSSRSIGFDRPPR
jgi:hypothetical protein